MSALARASKKWPAGHFFEFCSLSLVASLPAARGCKESFPQSGKRPAPGASSMLFIAPGYDCSPADGFWLRFLQDGSLRMQARCSCCCRRGCGPSKPPRGDVPAACSDLVGGAPSLRHSPSDARTKASRKMREAFVRPHQLAVGRQPSGPDDMRVRARAIPPGIASLHERTAGSRRSLPKGGACADYREQMLAFAE